MNLHDAATMMPDLEILLKIYAYFCQKSKFLLCRYLKCIYTLATVLPCMIVTWIIFEDFSCQIVRSLAQLVLVDDSSEVTHYFLI